MQLSRLYSNQDDIFTPISFNAGSDAHILNVIFATVKNKRDRDKDSHNLGKTTLIHLLNFLLLKKVSEENSFLIRHVDRFNEFIFFLEIRLDSKSFLTIRRSPSVPNEVSLKYSEETQESLVNLPENKWDHWNVSLTAALKIVDAQLNLQAIKPFDYRKGVSYFLRTQEDYSDFFQIRKFAQGKDREWKPYLANMLGLDHVAVYQKYILDDQINAALREKKQREIDLCPENLDRGQLTSRIDILRDEISQIDGRLDSFDFEAEERRISKKLVDQIETRASDVNTTLYDLDADIKQLEKSVKHGVKFNIDKIKQIYEESKIVLPDLITHSYEELVDFNKKLSRERNAAIRTRIKELSEKREKLIEEQAKLNEQRQTYLAIIKNADTFEKYKALQKELSGKRAKLSLMDNQLDRLGLIEELDQKIRDLNKKRDDFVTKIEISLRKTSSIKTKVTQLFNRFVKQVLSINGEFSASINNNKNIDFNIRTVDVLGDDTSQTEGHSYKKLLCALFDLAVLKSMEDLRFYHFVYHDGIFEGLDNRIKLNVLDLFKQIISEGKIQCIISVIDTDLPRSTDNDKPIHFSEDEIILTLHDEGDEGRLFKMAPF